MANENNTNPEGNGGETGKMFTQEEVNRIVSERLSRVKQESTPADDREKALNAREARLDCREYVSSKNYPSALLDAIDTSNVEKFKAAVDSLAEKVPGMVTTVTTIGAEVAHPPYFFDSGSVDHKIEEAFKPRI